MMSVIQRVAAGAVAILVSTSIGPIAIAAQSQGWDFPVNIRENGTNYTVYVGPLAEGELVFYDNGEDCGSTDHKTLNGGRRFAHLHVNYNLPHDAHITDNVNSEYHQVTQQKIDDYWDWKYGDSYAVVSAAHQHRWNCFTYAFYGGVTGLFWIQDKTRILEDDFQQASVQDGCVDVLANHAIKIVDVAVNFWGSQYINQTEEKNAQSDIYCADYVYSGPNPKGTIYIRVYK